MGMLRYILLCEVILIAQGKARSWSWIIFHFRTGDLLEFWYLSLSRDTEIITSWLWILKNGIIQLPSQFSVTRALLYIHSSTFFNTFWCSCYSSCIQFVIFQGSHFGFHHSNLNFQIHKKAFCAYMVVLEVNFVVFLNLGHTGEGIYVSQSMLSSILIHLHSFASVYLDCFSVWWRNLTHSRYIHKVSEDYWSAFHDGHCCLLPAQCTGTCPSASIGGAEWKSSTFSQYFLKCVWSLCFRCLQGCGLSGVRTYHTMLGAG